MTAADIEPVARRLLGHPNRAQSTNTQWRYGRKGSLAVDLEKNIWHDHEAGAGGGVLDLVCRENGGSRREAWDWLVEQELVDDDGEARNRPVTGVQNNRPDILKSDRHGEALAIWEASRGAAHTPAQDYLQCRGITIAPPASIRYHEGIHVLVAAVQDFAGEVTGIQRIFLVTDSRGTWASRKMSLGSIKGGACRLTPAAESLQLCESIEDGLALLQMTGRPTWAVPGAGFMESFEPPPGVTELVLAPDHDRAGLEAIEKALKASADRRLKLRRLLPPLGRDWCDCLEFFEERAAIREYDGLEDRDTAETQSWVETFVNGD
jgi:hypothetical protein